MNREVGSAWLLLCLGTLLASIQDGMAEKKIVCYYTNWSVYRPGTAKFSPQNINPYLCTHLIYAFGGFTKDNAMKPFDKYQDIEKGGYAKFTGLKTYNKNLKTMLAIGGWNEGSSRFSPMVADPDRRRQFVKNAIKFLRQNHFDGLDLDWEYPAFRDGGKPRDKNNYADLVQELREEFDRETSKTGRPRLLLTMAIPAGLEYLEKGYDLERLNEYLDFFNLLSYDYHSAYEPAVNHHAPLYPLEEDNEYNYDNELTIDYTINYLVRNGVSSEKIVLGIPTYGRSYTLFNEDATEIGSPADGPGVEGDATREKGYLAYYEICESLADSDEWEVVQPNPTAMGPYAFKGSQWVGYDDEDIVKLKARYVNERSLGGIMFWSIDNDDFRGKCHGRPYPLIEAAKESLLTSQTKDSSPQKVGSVSHRKKNRGNQGIQSNIIGRKLGRSSTTTTTTTVAPTSRKRLSSSGRSKFRSRKRNNEDEQEREVESRSFPSRAGDDDGEDGNSLRSIEQSETRTRSTSRPRGRAGNGRRKHSKRKEQKKDDAETEVEESLSVKLTTPEPPTTPDPGSDFKCEDEGFFSHPRDCKKYFWCLDSGPGGLGIVGHQFTCPSGLVFNKAADSCDYPRNVICPKAKTSQATVSTTRAPITAATSRTTYLHSPARRTTTSKPESEEEYEYYDDDEEEEEDSEEEEEEEVKEEPKFATTTKPLQYKTITRNKPTTTSTTTTTTTTTTVKPGKTEPEKTVDIEEEDPRVIKELINLIKKAGGIEQLEKQLLSQEKSTGSDNPENKSATPATISRTLYERVLNRQAAKAVANSRPAVATTVKPGNYANGPGGSQFEGLDEVPEVQSLRRTHKPQYVTIERPKPSTQGPLAGDEDEEEEEEDDEEEDDNTDVASEEESVGNPAESSTAGYRITPSYVNIRRNRPATTTSKSENDVEEKDADGDEEAGRPTRRRRPVFNKAVRNEEDTDESPKAEATEGEKSVQRSRTAEEASTAKSRYVGIQRFRSTTVKPAENNLVANQRTSVTSKTNGQNEEEKVTTTVASFRPTSTSETTTTRPTSSESDLSYHTSSSPSIASGFYSDSTLSSVIESTTSTTTPLIDEFSSGAATSLSSASTTASTESTVKLVEDSATEILLTTLQMSTNLPSLSSASTARATASATVSQPRPFSFTRRRLVTTPSSSSSGAPVTPSADNTRSKVSTASRNPARQSSTFLLGRTRTRSTTEATEIPLEEVQVESPQSNVEPSRSRQKGSGFRGTNRFTPPTTKSSVSRADELPENSGYRGRTRSRVRPSSRVNNESGVEATTASTAEEVTTKSRYKSRVRSSVRVSTEPTPVSSSVGYRPRGRNVESGLVTTDKLSTEAPRRRYGRPSRTTTEITAINEVEDSPIVRITQAQPRKSSIFKNRFGNNAKEEPVSEKITNIKVFKQPPTINHDLYDRTKTTRIDFHSVQTDSPGTESNIKTSDNTQETSSYFYATTPSLQDFQNIVNNDTLVENSTLENGNTVDNGFVNTVDDNPDEFSMHTTAKDTTEEITNELVETTTLQYDNTIKPTSDAETVSIGSTNSSEIVSPNVNATTRESYDIIKIIYGNSTDEINAVNNATSHPRKKKIILRRRPVNLLSNESVGIVGDKEENPFTNATTSENENFKHEEIRSEQNLTNTVISDDRENRQVIRRRKVIRRLRPVQNENLYTTEGSSTTTNVPSNLPLNEFTTQLYTQTTTPSIVLAETETPEDFTSTNSEETIGFTTFTTETTNIFDDNDVTDFTKVQTPNPELTTIDTQFSDFTTSEYLNNMISTSMRSLTDIDDVNNESSTLPSSSSTENLDLSTQTMVTTESVLDTDFTDYELNNTHEMDLIVTQTPIGVTEPISATTVQTTTSLKHLQSEATSARSVGNLESRYVRKKFVRKRPLQLSEEISRRTFASSTQDPVVSSTTEKSDAVALKRRKNLYVRRRPISTTTVRTTEASENVPNYEGDATEEEDQEERDLGNERIPETTTLRIPLEDNSPVASNSFFSNDAQQFWGHYTTGSSLPTIEEPIAILSSAYTAEEIKTPVRGNERENEQAFPISPVRRRYPIPQSTTEFSVTNDARSRYLGYRQPRTRLRDGFNRKAEEEADNKQNESKTISAIRSRYYLNRSPPQPPEPEEDEKLFKVFSSQTTKNRFYSRRPAITTTESSVTETLIPARKFDFAADALNRRQQTLRPSLRKDEDTASTESLNFVDDELTFVTTSKPLVTRLITSVAESGTTERQKILIKTKYSSYTSTTRIPIRGVQGLFENPSTTESVNSVRSSLEKSTNQAVNDDSIVNEIHPVFERSTLPIESEFAHRDEAYRFTTEPQGSSTIEIESVFSNLIPNSKEIAKQL